MDGTSLPINDPSTYCLGVGLDYTFARNKLAEQVPTGLCPPPVNSAPVWLQRPINPLNPKNSSNLPPKTYYRASGRWLVGQTPATHRARLSWGLGPTGPRPVGPRTDQDLRPIKI